MTADLAERDTIAAIVGPALDGPVAAALEARDNIRRLTAATEAAVLTPKDPGAWPHALRAALAARIARLNGEAALAARYLDGAGAEAALADPAVTDGPLAAVLSFMDKVAARTSEVAAGDIAALQAAGVSDADIVRLCELNAFLAYQIRLIAGLRLMGAAA